MRNNVELEIDLNNAVNYPEVDNFTCSLFRLIMKADGDNRKLLAKAYPVEVKMVEIFQGCCPYKKELVNDGPRIVDYKTLVEMAIDDSGEGRWVCGYCGANHSNRPPFDMWCIRCGRDRVHATAPIKPWPEEKQ